MISSYIKNKNFYNVVLVQFLLCIILSLFIFIKDTNNAISFFLGGISVIIPNSVLVVSFFCYSGARVYKRILSSIYLGVAGKFFCTIVICSMIFCLVDNLNPILYFASFFLLQIIGFITPVYLQRGL